MTYHVPSHLSVSVQMVFRVGAEMDAVGVTTMSKNSMAEVEEFKLKVVYGRMHFQK